MDPAGLESIVFVYIFPQFLPNKDGSGILQLGRLSGAVIDPLLPVSLLTVTGTSNLMYYMIDTITEAPRYGTYHAAVICCLMKESISFIMMCRYCLGRRRGFHWYS